MPVCFRIWNTHSLFLERSMKEILNERLHCVTKASGTDASLDVMSLRLFIDLIQPAGWWTLEPLSEPG